MTDNTCNGWTNYETWNASLWLCNDEGLYRMACNYERGAVAPTWIGFVESSGLEDFATPDGVSFTDCNLDYTELDEVIQEINA